MGISRTENMFSLEQSHCLEQKRTKLLQKRSTSCKRKKIYRERANKCSHYSKGRRLGRVNTPLHKVDEAERSAPFG